MSMQVVFDNRNRPVRTIPAKWHPLIWVMLVVISLFRNAVEVAADIAAAEGAAEIILSLLSAVVFSGGIPALLCYCCGLVLYTMSARRGYFFCHRDDFVYLVMLFTAGSRFVVGVINCFSFLEPAVGIYTSLAADVAVLPAAMFAMYFGVLAPRFMNPRTRADIFAMYGGMFFLLLGIFTVITCGSYLLVYGDSALSSQFEEILRELGYMLSEAEVTHIRVACILGLSLLAAWVIAYAAVLAVLRNNAKSYVPPAPPRPDGGSRPYDGDPFADAENGGGPENGSPDDGPGSSGGGSPSSSGGDDKVFEEFDI